MGFLLQIGVVYMAGEVGMTVLSRFVDGYVHAVLFDAPFLVLRIASSEVSPPLVALLSFYQSQIRWPKQRAR